MYNCNSGGMRSWELSCHVQDLMLWKVVIANVEGTDWLWFPLEPEFIEPELMEYGSMVTMTILPPGLGTGEIKREWGR